MVPSSALMPSNSNKSRWRSNILSYSLGATKAKNAPVRYANPENNKIRFDQTRAWVHARATSGSIGQGAFRDWYCKALLPAMRRPAIVKITSLCSENQTICGKAPTKPAKAAPKPKETNKAGRAQQINVPVEVKSAKNATQRFAF